jgi:hypothetical protein
MSRSGGRGGVSQSESRQYTCASRESLQGKSKSKGEVGGGWGGPRSDRGGKESKIDEEKKRDTEEGVRRDTQVKRESRTKVPLTKRTHH